MTIITDRLTPPAWDKGGERRVRMDPREAAKYKVGCTPSTALVAQAKDGRWDFATTKPGGSIKEELGAAEAAVKATKKGRFGTPQEAVDAAKESHQCIVNTAPASMVAPKKAWGLAPAPRKAISPAEARQLADATKKAHPVIGEVQAAARKLAGKKPGATRGPGIGSFCEGLILEGKTDEQVLAAVREKFPDAKTKEASVNWYRNKLIREGKLEK